MNKFLLALLAVPSLTYSMDYSQQQQQQNNNDNDSGLTSDTFLIHIKNNDVTEKYTALTKEYKSVHKWWRAQHKTGDFKSVTAKLDALQDFKAFAEMMESGPAELSSKHEIVTSLIRTQNSGLMVKVKVQPPAKVEEFKRSYLKSYFVSKIMAGAEAAEAYETKVQKEDAETKSESGSGLSLQDVLLLSMLSGTGVGHGGLRGIFNPFE